MVFTKGERGELASNLLSLSIRVERSEDYRPATQRIYHTPGQASFVELPVVK